MTGISPANFYPFRRMTTFAEHQAAPNEDAENEAKTGLPGIDRWRGVYALVLGIFVLLVITMSVFEWMFS